MGILVMWRLIIFFFSKHDKESPKERGMGCASYVWTHNGGGKIPLWNKSVEAAELRVGVVIGCSAWQRDSLTRRFLRRNRMYIFSCLGMGRRVARLDETFEWHDDTMGWLAVAARGWHHVGRR